MVVTASNVPLANSVAKIMYWFNYLDRNAIAVARLDGLEEELGLSSTQYVTSVSILFVGYILGQIPSSKCAPSQQRIAFTRTDEAASC